MTIHRLQVLILTLVACAGATRHTSWLAMKSRTLKGYQQIPKKEPILGQTVPSQEICFEPGHFWGVKAGKYNTQKNMWGQKRTKEDSAAKCQARCQSVPLCAHFSWWPDGGCHIQDAWAHQFSDRDSRAGGLRFGSGRFGGGYKNSLKNMAGQGRTVEASAVKCQARCQSVTHCAHFSWWPDGGCHIQDKTSRMMVDDHKVVAGGPRFGSGHAYAPLDMDGQGRTKEDSADECQARCQAVTDCAHFSWWPDGGCHIQDRGACQYSIHPLGPLFSLPIPVLVITGRPDTLGKEDLD